MTVTIAIPCYKSSKTIETVVDAVRKEFSMRDGYDYQFVLVDDCSPDGGDTFRTISKLAYADEKITALTLSRNFGQASAKMAAIEHVKGDILVYMDDDGQHDPAGIFQLVSAIENGADMAIAHFQNKQHSGFKRLTSWLNSQLLMFTIHKPKDLHTSSFCAYNRFLIDLLKEYNSPYVATFAFLLQHTNRIVNVQMEHHKRLAGESGYTLKKLFKLWGDGIFSYSTIPLKLIRYAGVLACILGFGFAVITLILIIIGKAHVAWVLLSAMNILSGVILLAQALIGEYMGRMYMTENRLPQYTIREVVHQTGLGEEIKLEQGVR